MFLIFSYYYYPQYVKININYNYKYNYIYKYNYKLYFGKSVLLKLSVKIIIVYMKKQSYTLHERLNSMISFNN